MLRLLSKGHYQYFMTVEMNRLIQDTKTKKSDLFLSAKGLTRKSNKKIFHLFNRTCNGKDLDQKMEIIRRSRNHKKKQKSMEGKGKLPLEGKRRRIDGTEGR
ncbi:hypothetical protein E1A91_D01G142700v1 [Gossypium mustelinum]|uniref:Uncharacterized protein n=3 Tax=Gossypium TaxID=3633 RepID=A0A5J5SNY6_GOSBA|nr:hypothetical protein ES319_D01G136800v1 [Gossypium barbadense]TYG83183.1 hypothetical protein ES288_D01G148600v1 [Gossypium darwinii]TYI97426.1 hypothetical protein E1A91_D01G142700v1 [Gossypium mustelinum]